MNTSHPLNPGTALIELERVSRTYGSGDTALTVLHDIDLRIERGDMVAIVGASGSGKSTLMNILGCLDTPSAGTYRMAGIATDTLDPDGLARLRREHLGFVFQRYQLLNDLSALANVETPAVYAGIDPARRYRRAMHLLERLGLGDRASHRPTELSGGQQQRVSVARALMNGGQILLADEPTGALDSQSGKALMTLLHELHAQGHTIIIVTHDMEVAQHARRIIELRDGRVVSDRGGDWTSADAPTATSPSLPSLPATESQGLRHPSAALDRLLEAFRLAMRSAATHRLRSFLTMLGIIVGIASVACMVARGEGSRQTIMNHIRQFGTDTISLFPGRMAGDLHAGAIHTLSLADVRALQAQPYVDSVTPEVTNNETLRVADKAVTATVHGTGADYFRVHGIPIIAGRAFDASLVESASPVTVIDQKTQQTLFGADSPIGKVILVGNLPCHVIGVSGTNAMAFSPGSLGLYMPYSSVMSRMTGAYNLQSVTIRLADGVPSNAALAGISALIKRRHGTADFTTFSSDTFLKIATASNESFRIFISSIALISLIVGGIGVMNIMLVSVTERTHEIGIRMAVGARRSDIRNQFLIEAIWLCAIGGLIGVVLAIAIVRLFSNPHSHFYMVLSMNSIGVAFASAVWVGVVFGYFPARQAARLSPAEALIRE
ncbi:MacB family efflux pump subunit [Pararobbsia silviterrae]|uniref:Pyoverdine export ATP-binding/permease protein PvdT n=1 Tax=Pararobbsia silviterrae TaxID=1792498 RepID=A0A494Y5K9_9BURK|nr:MacB family efflux pump subunit [Pararobbsia silviterrae]RKP57921.1 MacB family efflux pump subunit [Pararobbsia silviterrae]